jgi:cell division protein ZapA
VTTKNKAIVKIYGQEYAVVSDKDREHIQRLSNYVDDKMREISEKNKKLSTVMVAVLAALNMSEELFGEKEKIDEIGETNQAPDKVIKEMENEIADLKGLLNERAFDIERLENAVEEEKKASGAFKRNEEYLKEAIASSEKSIEEKDEGNRNLEKKIDELKNKLVECEVKLIQSRTELAEFMDAFEN